MTEALFEVPKLHDTLHHRFQHFRQLKWQNAVG